MAPPPLASAFIACLSAINSKAEDRKLRRNEKNEAGELRQDYLQIKALELAPQVYVCGQLFEQDLKLVAKQGVRSIMNNRPDNELMGQPLSADLAKAAEELGMTFVHFPVEPGPISRQDVEAFAKACDELERPLLIFSRSGARSTKIWETAESMEFES
jgi:uncharacterized protein (TIGR01244 family)